MPESAILTVQQGEKLLKALEAEAIEHFHNSEEAFNRAIMALYKINEGRLWEYGKDEDGVMLRDYEGGGSFEIYLGWFCKKHGVSRSGVQFHLGTIRTWTKALGRPENELMEVGIKRAAPVKKLVKIDGRSGEVELPSQEVLDELPLVSEHVGLDGDELALARINLKIDETLIHPAEPLTDSDVRKALTIDVDKSTVQVTFFYNDDGDVVYTWETSDELGDGVLFWASEWKEIPSKVWDKIAKRLRVINHG